MAVGLCLALGGGAWAAFRPEPAAQASPPISAPAQVAEPEPSLDSSIGQQAQPAAAAPAPTIPESLPPSEPAKPKVVKKEYGLLTVASEPWGTLFIGNKEIGPTPIADYPLPIGSHRLRIEQEGYRTKLETIVVTGPNPIRRRYILEPAGPQ
jgi:hypothetical protein